MLGLTLHWVQAVPPGWAQADQPADQLNRPAYQLLRFDEDWSGLRGLDLNATGDFWDRLKFIPLTPDARPCAAGAWHGRGQVCYA
jgi:hypothetical protein